MRPVSPFDDLTFLDLLDLLRIGTQDAADAARCNSRTLWVWTSGQVRQPHPRTLGRVATVLAQCARALKLGTLTPRQVRAAVLRSWEERQQRRNPPA